MLQLSFLGPFQVVLRGQSQLQFATNKVRALLAYLALEADREHERAALAGLLWPEMPEAKALNNLSKTLGRLRRSLRDGDGMAPAPEVPYLLVARQTVGFNSAANYRLDVSEFRQYAGPRAGVAQLEQAVALYRGELLAGFSLPGTPAFAEWLLLWRERLHQQALSALERLAAHYLQVEKYEQVRRYALRQLELDPWRETAYMQMMQALALSGDRSAALAQYEWCRELLAEELGVAPDAATTALYEQIKAGRLRREVPPMAPRHNLPATLTPLVGREQEVARLVGWLQDPVQRLVTIVGEGGSGKTHLALVVARELRQQYRHGTWFVPLAGVDGSGGAEQIAARLAAAVAGALGFTLSGTAEPATELMSYLRRKELLLVLDNFEHLTAAATFLVALLEGATDVRVLVTTRLPLGVRAERLLPLPGLSIPEPFAEVEDAATAATYSSVQLFLSLAERRRANVALERDLPAIIQICRLVDGLPLGIELAAGWAGHFSCDEIARAIQENLDFLTTLQDDVPARQRSLRAAFDYSWDLLSSEEQGLLAQLSLFRGEFSRQAALHITQAKVLELVGLVSKFLLRTTPPGRYEMHERLRQFAGERLVELTDAHAVAALRARHSAFYLALLADGEESLRGPHGLQVVKGLRVELDNVRHAWEWAVAGGHLDKIRRAARGLSSYYDVAGLPQEGEQALRLAVDRLAQVEREGHEGEGPLQVTQAILLAEQSFHLNVQAKYARGLRLARRAVELAQAAGDVSVEVRALLVEGSALSRLGFYQAAHSMATSTVARAQASNLPRMEAHGLRLLALTHHERGDYPTAGLLWEQSLSLYRRLGDSLGEFHSLQLLSGNYETTGHLLRAREYRERVLQIARELGNPRQIGSALLNLGGTYAFLGDLQTARAHLERSLEIAAELDDLLLSGHALDSLSRVCFSSGEVRQALLYNEEAVNAAQASKYKHLQVDVLLQRGYLLFDEGALLAAVEAGAQARTLAQEAGLSRLRLECQALLGRISLAQGSPKRALAQVEPVIRALADEVLISVFEVFKSYHLCYEVLAAAEDPRAGEFLEMAHTLLQTWADRIDDETLQRSFLENIPAHRQIVAEWERLHRR